MLLEGLIENFFQTSSMFDELLNIPLGHMAQLLMPLLEA
jgi:hypothetical protein